MTVGARQYSESATHVDVFVDLVDDLLQLAANHPSRTIRLIATRSICSFAMLKGGSGMPCTLDGPEVLKAIDHAIMMIKPPEGNG